MQGAMEAIVITAWQQMPIAGVVLVIVVLLVIVQVTRGQLAVQNVPARIRLARHMLLRRVIRSTVLTSQREG